MSGPDATVVGLRIEPLDTLFFRDGRPFDAAGYGRGGLPTPRTLAGALRTALLASEGFSFSALKTWRQGDGKGAGPDRVRDFLTSTGVPAWIVEARFRGPWLAFGGRSGAGPVEPLLPVPATLLRDGPSKEHAGSGAWVRAWPMTGDPPPGWPADHRLLPIWRSGRPDAKPPGGLLRPSGICAFLAGRVPADGDWVGEGRLYGFDARVGIGVDPDRLTASEGLIYSVRMLSLRNAPNGQGDEAEDVCFYAEIVIDRPAPAAPDDLRARLAEPIPFGGEGRYARVAVLDRPFDWAGLESGRPEGAPAGRELWLLTTPGLFRDGAGGLPTVAEPGRLRAAASGNPLAVSGWDVAAGGPRPTRFAMPAGSVYFVEGASVPRSGSVCDDAEDVAQGWGMVLRGAWNG